MSVVLKDMSLLFTPEGDFCQASTAVIVHIDVGYIMPIFSHVFIYFFINKSQILSFCVLAQAERQAVNTKIQGSAADLVKSSLVLLDRTLRGKMTEVQLIHQIHDELLFQVWFTHLKLL